MPVDKTINLSFSTIKSSTLTLLDQHLFLIKLKNLWHWIYLPLIFKPDKKDNVIYHGIQRLEN